MAGSTSRGFTTRTSSRRFAGCSPDDDVDGIVNVAAPNPLPNAEFMRVLRHAAGVPFGLPANRLMLEAGAVFMRTETELILKSRRVVPGTAARAWLCLQVSELARCGCRSLPSVEGDASRWRQGRVTRGTTPDVPHKAPLQADHRSLH